MGEFFGTDGIRGVAGEFPLVADTIERIGYSLARHIRQTANRPARLLIGGDTRESGKWIEEAFAKGACAAEADVTVLGIITTPGVAYLTRILQADAGVVISASHNPYHDNGIKVFVPSGGKLDEAMEQAIERDLTDESLQINPVPGCSASRDEALKERYLGFLRDELAYGLDLSGIKMVLDCANGASYQIAPALFRALKADVHSLHCSPNGKNINLSCGSLHPHELQKAVTERKADIGLAFDGDADRLLVVDETGTLVDGDHIMYILAKHMQAKRKLAGNRVVATVMSNVGLEVALADVGIALTRTRVGDKYVLDELLACGGTLGGEQSGHIIFPEISLAGDAMITAIEVLKAVKESGKKVSQLRSGFKTFPQVIVNVPVKSKPPLDTIPPVKEAMVALEQQFGTTGRLVVRYSGTEDVVRVMLEGADEQIVREHANSLANLIKQHIG